MDHRDEATTRQQAAQRAAASARAVGYLFGAGLAVPGVLLLAVGIATSVTSGEGVVDSGGVVSLGLGAALLTASVALLLRARGKGKHAAWLRLNGLRLTAHVVDARPTGTSINDVPVYRFVLRVAGPHGPYTASFDRLAPEHLVAMAMGRQVRIRANPDELEEVIPED